MILYYAAAESGLKELSNVGVNNLLITMANGKNKIPKVPDFYEPNGYNLIVDSGAFTYHKKGGISLREWMTIAKRLKPYSNELIGLDVIGDAQKSWDNYEIIIKEFDCIPTFHIGSDMKFLERYLKHTDRIAIGGMVGMKSNIKGLQSHLNDIFTLFSKTTVPKFHAFGYFSQQILENYPFYSADASTWQNYSRFGEFHRFVDFEYKRVKSMRVDRVRVERHTIEDLAILKEDDPLVKLAAIKETIDYYELYLTNLWKKRGVKW